METHGPSITTRSSYHGLQNVCKFIHYFARTYMQPVFKIVQAYNPTLVANMMMRCIYGSWMKLLLQVHQPTANVSSVSNTPSFISMNNLFNCAIPTTFHHCYVVLQEFMQELTTLYIQLDQEGIYSASSPSQAVTSLVLYNHPIYMEYNKWNINIYYQVSKGYIFVCVCAGTLGVII